MKILIAGWLDFAPEVAERLIPECAALIEAGRAEPGCLAYDWSLDPLKPGRMHVYEEWTGQAALQKHFDEEPYKLMGGALQAETILGMDIRKFAVTAENTVYDDAGVPRSDFDHVAG